MQHFSWQTRKTAEHEIIYFSSGDRLFSPTLHDSLKWFKHPGETKSNPSTFWSFQLRCGQNESDLHKFMCNLLIVSLKPFWSDPSGRMLNWYQVWSGPVMKIRCVCLRALICLIQVDLLKASSLCLSGCWHIKAAFTFRFLNIHLLDKRVFCLFFGNYL